MKKILSKTQWLIAKHFVSLVAVFAVLVVAFVAIAPDLTFGWFSQNNSVNANGMTVQADHASFEVYYRVVTSTSAYPGEDWILLDTTDEMGNIMEELKAPDDEVTFEIKLINRGQRSIQISRFGLDTPTDAEEKPKTVDGKQYYLSTEIYTSILAVKDANGTSLSGVTSSNQTFLRVGNTTPAPIDYISFVTDPSKVVIPKDGAAIFTLSMTFFNRQDVIDAESGEITLSGNQNVFKNFGKDANNNSDPAYGVCRRKFYFTYNE